MHIKLTLSLLCGIVAVNNSENKFGTFKNVTKGSQNQWHNDHIGFIKMEIKKYMSECGADVSNEESAESKNNNKNSTMSNNSNTNSGRYGDNRNLNSNRGFGTYNPSSETYGHSGLNRDFNRDQNNRDFSETSYGSWGGSGQSTGGSGIMSFNRSGFGNYGYGHESDSYGNGNSGSMNGGRRNYGSEHESFGYGGGYLRPKRSEDDIECISQCVFGYLEVLDDNRSPSESAMIKWLQDHMPNDGKRIKAIRDSRRCFSRLAASYNEDGCEFSKSLSKCLNLEIEK